jgi:hypothetical protein
MPGRWTVSARGTRGRHCASRSPQVALQVQTLGPDLRVGTQRFLPGLAAARSLTTSHGRLPVSSDQLFFI